MGRVTPLSHRLSGTSLVGRCVRLLNRASPAPAATISSPGQFDFWGSGDIHTRSERFGVWRIHQKSPASPRGVNDRRLCGEAGHAVWITRESCLARGDQEVALENKSAVPCPITAVGWCCITTSSRRTLRTMGRCITGRCLHGLVDNLTQLLP